MHVHNWFLATILLVGCGSGCGSGASADDADAGPEPDAIPLESFYDSWTAAECELRVRCSMFGDTAECLAAMIDAGGSSSHATLLASISDGRIDYDGVAAAVCIEERRAATCDARAIFLEIFDDYFYRRDPCPEAFRGLVELDGACASPLDCAGDAYCSAGECNPDEACCAGQCAARVPPGSPCDEVDQCQAGSFCSGTCTRYRQDGESCEDQNWCDPSLDCVPTESGHFCGHAPARGEPCLVDGWGLPCASVLDRCDRSGACSPRLGAGAGCEFVHDCVLDTHCADVDDTTGTDYRCAPWPVLGESCATSACQVGVCSASYSCVAAPPPLACGL